MAVQKLKGGKTFNLYIQHFLIDNKNDLEQIEKLYNPRFGDKAELPDGSIYIRHSNEYEGDKWSLISNAELPEVTTDDNGKILSVVDGAWDKIESSSVFSAKVIFYYDEDEGKWAVDSPLEFDEIYNKILNGDYVFFYEPDSGTVLSCVYIGSDDGTRAISVQNIYIPIEEGAISRLGIVTFSWMEDGSVEPNLIYT